MSDDSYLSTAISTRPLQCSKSQPLNSDRISAPDDLMSDHDLLKKVFVEFVRERRKRIRSWMSDKNITMV